MLCKSMLSVVIIGSALSAAVASAVDTMYAGQTLFKGQQIESANKCFRLIMQNDGNLVIYRNRDNAATWASGTWHSGSVKAVMQHDGNFVMYDNGDHAKWNSGTWNYPESWLLMQNDGNLVIYKANSWSPIWASNTVTGC